VRRPRSSTSVCLSPWQCSGVPAMATYGFINYLGSVVDVDDDNNANINSTTAYNDSFLSLAAVVSGGNLGYVPTSTSSKMLSGISPLASASASAAACLGDDRTTNIAVVAATDFSPPPHISRFLDADAAAAVVVVVVVIRVESSSVFVTWEAAAIAATTQPWFPLGRNRCCRRRRRQLDTASATAARNQPLFFL
jgi:hypothetical protein